MTPNKPIQVVITTAGKDEAMSIATALVDEGLAACVQISGEVTSLFRWQGKLETSTEWCCSIKSDQRLFTKLDSRIRELHSYDVPEILAFEILDGNTDYLQWLDQQLRSD